MGGREFGDISTFVELKKAVDEAHSWNTLSVEVRLIKALMSHVDSEHSGADWEEWDKDMRYGG